MPLAGECTTGKVLKIISSPKCVLKKLVTTEQFFENGALVDTKERVLEREEWSVVALVNWDWMGKQKTKFKADTEQELLLKCKEGETVLYP